MPIILEGIKFILTNNTFEFNREYYKQIKGTAMGRAVGEQIAKESPEKECEERRRKGGKTKEQESRKEQGETSGQEKTRKKKREKHGCLVWDPDGNPLLHF